MTKPKLELTWIGKDRRPKLEPRILLEDPAKSYHAKFKNAPSPEPAEGAVRGDIFDNRLIFGDNLLALKALEQEFSGKVKCVFIDPPYNTGSAFTHYDDGLEHSLWLSLMRDRLEIIRRLLADDGSLWITIDDNECHYLKVMCDEIFGRGNFVANVVWQKRTSPDNRLRLGDAHDNVLVYKKNSSCKESFNQLQISESRAKDFKNPDNDPRGSWASTDFTGMTGHATPNQFYTIYSPNGVAHPPPEGRCWAIAEDTFKRLLADNRVWFGKSGNSRPRLKRFLCEMDGQNSWTWWPNSEVGHNQEAKKEISAIFGAADTFDTPKPERLIKRVLEIATHPGDLVLDSFAGSGTTGAVAHKMGRRWIMIELGEHCHTHIIPRLRKVIDGDDPGGITQAVDWRGGGGFRYYRLAPSLLEKDRWGNWVINPEYNAAMLAEALCKLEGFSYAPSETAWWQHGHSSERDFIYVTTQNLSAAQLQALAEEVGSPRAPGRSPDAAQRNPGESAPHSATLHAGHAETETSLLVLCSAWHGVSAAEAAARWPHLTLKKIPKVVLSRCEWGHDDYSLNVENLPLARPPLRQAQEAGEERLTKTRQGSLFGGGEK